MVDQAEPHKNREAIRFCRENMEVVVWLPAHTTHVMQLLDEGVFGPLKRIFDRDTARLGLVRGDVFFSEKQLPPFLN